MPIWGQGSFGISHLTRMRSSLDRRVEVHSPVRISRNTTGIRWYCYLSNSPPNLGVEQGLFYFGNHVKLKCAAGRKIPRSHRHSSKNSCLKRHAINLTMLMPGERPYEVKRVVGLSHSTRQAASTECQKPRPGPHAKKYSQDPKVFVLFLVVNTRRHEALWFWGRGRERSCFNYIFYGEPS